MISANLKNRIRVCFNKAWKTYDDHCDVQSHACQRLIKQLLHHGDSFPRVADFACGTGVSTQQLAQKIHYQKLYAIDFSQQLLLLAQKKLISNRVNFILSDYDTKLFPDQSLNLVFCNMGLQWAFNLNYTLRRFHACLCDSGLLAFSIPMKGTFKEINDTLHPIYPTLTEIETQLETCNFKLLSQGQYNITKRFTTAQEAIRSIRAVGANCNLSRQHDKLGLSKRITIEDTLVQAARSTLTYQIGLYVASKR